MRENLLELGAQVLLIIVYGVGAIVATIAGVLIEAESLGYLIAGDYRTGLWLGVLGLIALGFAYLLITDKVWKHARPGLYYLMDRMD